MNIIRNTSIEWLVGKSVIKIDNTLEHFLSQNQHSPELRNGLQKIEDIAIEKILLKALEINFDDLSNLPSEFTFYAKDIQIFNEAIQKLSNASDNTG